MSISVNSTTARTNCRPKPRSIWAKLLTVLTVQRQRRQLLELDDHILDDIGLTRSEAHTEAHEPMWNVPNHWRK